MAPARSAGTGRQPGGTLTSQALRTAYALAEARTKMPPIRPGRQRRPARQVACCCAPRCAPTLPSRRSSPPGVETPGGTTQERWQAAGGGQTARVHLQAMRTQLPADPRTRVTTGRTAWRLAAAALVAILAAAAVETATKAPPPRRDAAGAEESVGWEPWELPEGWTGPDKDGVVTTPTRHPGLENWKNARFKGPCGKFRLTIEFLFDPAEDPPLPGPPARQKPRTADLFGNSGVLVGPFDTSCAIAAGSCLREGDSPPAEPLCPKIRASERGWCVR